MYLKFFALTRVPFSLVSDPDCIHLSAQHADVINGLVFGVLERKGYLVLTGQPGLGKTTALRALSQLLRRANASSSVIFAPTLTATEFLEMAMMNFGFREIPESKARRLKMLEEFLLCAEAEGRAVALIVDEAHQLSPELLEELRLLGNFETADCKLLQIVLAGQNQFNDLLNQPDLFQLKQRIALRLSLEPLDRDAVEEYVRFRWEKAGGGEQIPFNAEAVDAIAEWSHGTPRLINSICDSSLLIAFSETTREVDEMMVREACQELSFPTPDIPRTRDVFARDGSLVRAPGADASASIEPEGSEPIAEAANGSRSSLLNKLGFRSKAQGIKAPRSRTGILPLNEP